MNPQLYEIYKPLRNHLRPVAIENALYVIWAYANFFQFEKSFPKDIQVDGSIIETREMPNRAILEWEIALLAREVIVNSQRGITLATKDFRNWSYFADAINKLKYFEDNAWPIFGNVSNVLREVGRIARRQFPWETKPNSTLFVRYFKIFNNPRISKIIEGKINLTVQQWYIIGMAILGALLNNPKFNIDPEISISGLTKREFDIFISLTSANLDGITEIIKRDVAFDDEFVYSFNPLEYYPLLRIDKYYYCPLTTFLAWRITSGLYFDLVDDKNFGYPFGLSFQDYLEEISKIVISNKTIKILLEKKYTIDGNEKYSVDLILSGEKAALFVEAKTKRLTAKSKSEFLSNESIDKDLEILANDIVQVYSTISDYLGDAYSHFPYHKDTKIYPLVVTLEDWFVFAGDAQNLRAKVRNKLLEKGMPEKYLEEMPYSVCSASDFEYFIQIMNNHSVNEVMNLWFTPDKIDNNFGQFLITQYRGEYKNIDKYFPEDFRKIYSSLKIN